MTERLAATTARAAAAARSSPSASPAASAPLSVSPAPVASTAVTGGDAMSTGGPSRGDEHGPGRAQRHEDRAGRRPGPRSSPRAAPGARAPGLRRPRTDRPDRRASSAASRASSPRLGVSTSASASSGRSRPVRRGRVEHRRRPAIAGHAERRPGGGGRDLVDDEHDVARSTGSSRASAASTCAAVELGVRPRRDRDQVLAAGVDEDQRDARGRVREARDLAGRDALAVERRRPPRRRTRRRPARPTSATRAPSRAAATAWLPPLPPWKRLERPAQHGLARARAAAPRARRGRR